MGTEKSAGSARERCAPGLHESVRGAAGKQSRAEGVVEEGVAADPGMVMQRYPAGAGRRMDNWSMTPELSSALGVGALTDPGDSQICDGPVAVQRKSAIQGGPLWSSGGGSAEEPASPNVREISSRGVEGASSPLPHQDAVQRSFGKHDVSDVRTQTGGAAADSSMALGAAAFTTDNRIAFSSAPDLHTAAHEAAHVVQQKKGVQVDGGLGAAGDAYERHADAVADLVVAGRSAEGLLDSAPSGGSSHAVQRRDDREILSSQAKLPTTDVEIPALEGALLQTRQEALRQGLLSQASFDASLALSQAMTQLQPAVTAGGAVDAGLQEQAAVAASQLFASLQKETSDEKNFKIQPSSTPYGGASVTSVNPYTEEMRVSTYFLFWMTSQNTVSWLERLPEFIRAANWGDAFRGYRRMLDGFDLWVADRLRQQGKGSEGEALGNAHQFYSQLRTGLEQIAGKHAKRIPSLFHPDPALVAEERAAGRPAADTIPMNVYYWKDEQTGKFHLYDLTTPSHPHEQQFDREPSAASMATFFEEVARYPKGEARYTLPDGSNGAAPTTGKIKWYEWIGYVGLALAGVGLALLSGGMSIPATVCFAAGTLAGGLAAGGHLADSTSLGTATTASIVLDVAQIVGAFASFGALSISIRAGASAAGLANSRWFIPLTSTAAGADVVQLVALTDITFTELQKVQNGAGSAEDKSRAISVLITQLIVTGGLAALSVKGARDVHALSGKQLEVVEQNGVQMMRVVGEELPLGPREELAAGMRRQMEIKNGKLIAAGKDPRYPDLDAAVTQGMQDLAKAVENGHPYGFANRAAFEEFGKQLRSGVAAKTVPEGGIAIPMGDAMVQGSATYRPAADDIDVALLVDQQQFNRLIEQSFPNQVAKVRQRGIDPLSMTMADATSAAEKTLANAVMTGILKRDKVVPRLSDVRDMLESLTGRGVDLSIVKRGGTFDLGPYFPIP